MKPVWSKLTPTERIAILQERIRIRRNQPEEKREFYLRLAEATGRANLERKIRQQKLIAEFKRQREQKCNSSS